MNLIQTLRRIGQQMNGWRYGINMLNHQLIIIKKLYTKHGLEIKLTCDACPEQYEVFKDGVQVAYYRLRHGEFRVDHPSCGDETIYEAEPLGDGMFYEKERLVYLTKALRCVLSKIQPLSTSR